MDEMYQVPAELSRVRAYEEAVAEVEREIAVRKRCYARWIGDGRLDSITAAERFERLKAALTFMQKPG